MFHREDLGTIAIVNDHFLEVAEKLPLSAPPPFEDIEEDENHQYLTLFDDHPEGEVVLITHCSIPRMRVEKGELSWDDNRFRRFSGTKLLTLVPHSREFLRS